MNLHRAKKIIDDVALVLRDMDSANSRVLAEALENAHMLLEDEIIRSETKAPHYRHFQGWSIDDIEEGRAPLSVLRQYKQVHKYDKGQKYCEDVEKEDYTDKDFIDELRKV